MSSVPTLRAAIEVCLATPEFMAEYRRLTGHALGTGTPLDREVDRVTGRLDTEAEQFFTFVRDHVWLPVVIGLAGAR